MHKISKVKKLDGYHVFLNKIQTAFQDIPPHEMEKIVSFIVKDIVDVVQKSGSVKIKNFGTFSIKISKERSVKVPHSGVAVTAPQKKSLYFKPSKTLKNKVTEFSS